MKIFKILFLCLVFVMTISSKTAISGTEQFLGHGHNDHHHVANGDLMTSDDIRPSLKAFDEVLLYCNTKKFMKNMVSEQYKMQLAADGLIHDKKHKNLAKVEMWVHPLKGQWAIVFIYKNEDKSCVLGGNDIELHTP